MSQIGSINHKAKLTEDDVRQIKKEATPDVPNDYLAERYGVSRKTIWRIRHGKGWTHV